MLTYANSTTKQAPNKQPIGMILMLEALLASSKIQIDKGPVTNGNRKSQIMIIFKRKWDGIRRNNTINTKTKNNNPGHNRAQLRNRKMAQQNKVLI